MKGIKGQNDWIFPIMKTSGIFLVDADSGVVWRRTQSHGIFSDNWKPCGFKSGVDGRLQMKFTHDGETVHIYLSRFIWFWFNGDIPVGMEVDHKNNVHSDNRPENLQLLSGIDNKAKSRPSAIPPELYRCGICRELGHKRQRCGRNA